MNKRSIRIPVILALIVLVSFSFNWKLETSKFDREGAKEMFEYLQKLRQKKVPKSDPLIKYVKEKGLVLTWNDTLAHIAEMRAIDMAKKNYFDHVDKKGYGVNYHMNEAGYRLEKEWLDKRSNNFFESLEAGHETPYEVIENLVVDKGVPSKGHRKHLLGLDDWNRKNTDIGIAYLRVGDDLKTEYSTYTVIIIARHSW